MYKCCDCGCEYKVKPDFCDCGNDTFEEIAAAIVDSDEELVPAKKRKKTFSEQYPSLNGFMKTLDPISVIIFILCIILSICSFIFIKPRGTGIEQTQKEEQKIERKVADINTFWNDTPPKPEPKIANQTPTTTENLVNQIINIIPKTETSKPQTTNKIIQKTKTTVQKPTQTKSATTKPKTQTTKPSTTVTSKPKTNTTQNQQQMQQIKPTNTIQSQPQNQTPQITQPQQQIQIQTQSNTISPQQIEQELKTFKRGLQSAYASRIKGNLLQVYGDGNCILDFKVDSTGKITNRSFSKQSTNNTLNDAVYNSVMSMPSYKTPPSSYKGQTLHLSVSITNGMAQISVY